VLKFHAAFHGITLSANYDERSEKADYLEFPAQFFSVPDLPVLGFKSHSSSRLGIDFAEALTASRFSGVVHRAFPFLRIRDAVEVYNETKGAFPTKTVGEMLTVHEHRGALRQMLRKRLQWWRHPSPFTLVIWSP
jgi:hypothetical protein